MPSCGPAQVQRAEENVVAMGQAEGEIRTQGGEYTVLQWLATMLKRKSQYFKEKRPVDVLDCGKDDQLRS